MIVVVRKNGELTTLKFRSAFAARQFMARGISWEADIAGLEALLGD